MQRYFFHLIDDLDVADHEGQELADLDAAWVYARNCARALMCETLMRDGRISLHHHIDIEDESGAVVGIQRFSDAVLIEG
jgi:hypothetical protein